MTEIFGAKLLAAKGHSLNGKYIYTLDGTWNTVPGNGGYLAVEGNLLAGGPGKYLQFFEGRDPTGVVESVPAGVLCCRELRAIKDPGDKISDSLRIEILLFQNLPLPAGLTSTGNLILRSYPHPLPAGLTSVGHLVLGTYRHPLPAGLTHVGFLDLGAYQHPLPAGLIST